MAESGVAGIAGVLAPDVLDPVVPPVESCVCRTSWMRKLTAG